MSHRNTTLSAPLLLLAVLLALLTAGCGGQHRTVSLDDLELSLYDQEDATHVSFETYTTDAELVLPRRVLSGPLTGSLTYLYDTHCEKVSLSGEGFGLEFLCKSGGSIGAEDLDFSQEDYRDSLEAAGYDRSDIRYESYLPSDRSLSYVTVFAADGESGPRLYGYANAVDLDQGAMYTILAYLDSPREGEQRFLEELLSSARFSTRSPEAMAALAAEGDVRAQFYVGLCCYAGNDMAQSDEEACAWLERSAQGGYRPARLYWGCFTFYGIGTPEDQERGLAILSELAEEGYAPAGTMREVLLAAQAAPGA